MALTIFSATISFHISCCVYIEAFFDSWDTILEQMDNLLLPKMRENDLGLKMKLIELAQYHSEILRLAVDMISRRGFHIYFVFPLNDRLIRNVAGVMQGTIFSHLYGNVGLFATSVYLMERVISLEFSCHFLNFISD